MVDEVNGKEVTDLIQKGDEFSKSMAEVVAHVRKLEALTKLEKLDKLDTISDEVVQMNDKLLQAVLGKNQIPIESFEKMILELKNYRASTIRLMFLVVLSLVGILVYLLTGERFGFIRALH